MNKMKDNNIVPWFSLGDIGGIAYVVDEFGLPEAQPMDGSPVPAGSRKPF